MNFVVALKRADCVWFELSKRSNLTAKSVQGTSLALQSVDNIHGGDSLPLGVLGVGDGITDDVLKEDLEDTTGLFVDESRDTLDSSTSRQTTDGGLGDALDVITKYLAVTLGASLAQSLASFATSSHVASMSVTDGESGGHLSYMQSVGQSQIPLSTAPIGRNQDCAGQTATIV